MCKDVVCMVIIIQKRREGIELYRKVFVQCSNYTGVNLNCLARTLDIIFPREIKIT